MVDNPLRLGFRRWWDGLSGDQRFSLSVFGICGTLTLGLSLAYLHASLTSPFLVPNATLQLSQAVFQKQEANAHALEALQKKDTDQDGLSDYAEIYLYKTSAYLPDTDSDGVTDAIEIAQGTNPNCPEGTNCLQLVNSQPSGTTTSTFANLLDTTKVPTAEEVLLGAKDPSVIGAQTFLADPKAPSEMTIDEIRTYLTENNLVPADTVSGMTDDEVTRLYLAAYNQVMRINEAKAQAAATGQQNGTSTATLQQTTPIPTP